MVQYDFYNDCWKWFLLPTSEAWQVYQDRIYKHFPILAYHNLGRVKLKYNKMYVIYDMYSVGKEQTQCSFHYYQP